ncbi:MAG: hypothetical protein F9K29_25365 [Hyphomicrobiaceae bacterium]|nr:MAG: hypothetical protein F9K29_25365 [Hyphomicrobiaceae bacterium]
MAQSGDQLWNPVSKTCIIFISTAEESAGKELVVDWIVDPGKRLVAAAHLHPGPQGAVAETLEVLAGVAGCRIGRETLRGAAAARVGSALQCCACASLE